MKKRVLLVGGVAVGATAATRLRRLDEELEIVIYEKGEFVSFANCGLPYHIGEVIEERDALLVTTKESLWDRYRIEVRNNSEVIGLDGKNKKITVRSGNESYEDSFDYLILGPGAMPMRPPIPGIEGKKILGLRNIPDMDAIKAYADKGAKSVAVIGGGFIGVEVAENLKERGLRVSLIEAAPHILAPLDTEMSMICENEMRDKGVELTLNDGVKSFEEIEEGVKITLASGKEIISDFVVAAIGVKPDTGFLKDSGIELNERGYIKVDKKMETNIKGIFAGGDATEITDFVTGSPATIALAGPANRQARIIADNIMGMNKEYMGSLGTSIIKVFDLTAAATGNNERILDRKGIKHKAVIVSPYSHANYYPGASQMTLKVIVDMEGRILGAQAVGYDGIDKVIDVIATVIKFKGSYKDLAELDLAYAPPYSSAKSPANVAGFVLENSFNKMVEVTDFNDYRENFNPERDVLIDVRDEVEVENGKIDNALNIPLNSLRDRLGELPKDKRIWIYCQIGLRGYLGSRILNMNNIENKNLCGGYRLLSLARVDKGLDIKIREKKD